jgi:crossover junction endodeoxyribonuclease RusA
MIVKLPYPDKVIWPNGRTLNRKYKSASVKAHRGWAHSAALGAKHGQQFTAPVTVRLVVYPKARGPLPDQDNCIAACKAYLDGIADAIGINDRDFTAPVVEYGDRTKRGDFVLEVK